MSAPAPMAIPIFAFVSAGASFIPSPTIATLPCPISSLITLSFPSGRTPAITSSTPACAPMAFAVLSLSPVSMTTLIPISFKSLTAAGLSSFIVSATAIRPHNLLSCAKRSGVFPSFASSSAFCLISSDTFICLLINLKLPPVIVPPLYCAVRPFPGSILNPSTSSAFIFLLSASFTTAFASGCSLFASSE